MSKLHADVGWKSINHAGEQLCGDHVEVIRRGKDSLVAVLADGLGSGVKASILSTLTSTIISTMLDNGMELNEIVDTIVSTLPVDKEKEVAYSTFTVLHVKNNEEVDIIQFDNPEVILIRGFEKASYPVEEITLNDKKILKSTLKLREGDVLVAVSDGCTHASAGLTYNYRWTRDDVADYVKIFSPVGYTAKTLASMLMQECFRLYGGKPIDDATALIVRMQPSQSVNIMFGPPKDASIEDNMLQSFMKADGRHIISGGTTAKLAARYLGKEIVPIDNLTETDIPPMSMIEGADLVTEGIITMNRVNEYAADILDKNELYDHWSNGKDGASAIARMLFEEGTDIHFYFGTAANEAHEDNVFGFSIKMRIVKELQSNLEKMSKNVTVSYY